jgi:hypothetical protein
MKTLKNIYNIYTVLSKLNTSNAARGVFQKVDDLCITFQVYLVIYPFLRILLMLIFILSLQFLFLSNSVHAEASAEAPEGDSSVNVPKTNLLRFALVFGGTCVVIAGLVFYMNGTLSAPSVPEEFYYFSKEISVPVQSYSIDLFNHTLEMINPTVNAEVTVSLYSLCLSHMLKFFSENPEHVTVVNEIKSLVLPTNAALRQADQKNTYVQVLRCYAEMFTQLNSDIERNICKAIQVNHRILTVYDPALNHEQILTRLFGNGGNGIKRIIGLFDKSVTRVLMDETLSSMPSSPVLDSVAITSSSHSLYDIFAKKNNYLDNATRVLSTIQENLPGDMWDLPGKAISGESPSLIFLHSLDDNLIMIMTDPNHLFYLIKMKAGIATYNALSASGLLGNQEIADSLFSAFIDFFGNEYKYHEVIT